MKKLTTVRMQVVVEVENHSNGKKIAIIYLGTTMVPIEKRNHIEMLEKIVEKEFEKECRR